MSPQELLTDLARRGVRLWADGDRLRYQGPDRVLTDDLLGLVRARKEELLSLLRNGHGRGHGGAAFPLSHGQRALWFINRLAPDSSAYHVGFLGRITGSFSLDLLREAFAALSDRHTALRTTYHLNGKEPEQRVHARMAIPLSVHEGSTWSQPRLDAFLRESYRVSFDLGRGPICRADIVKQATDGHLLLLTAHHIALDLRSLSVMLDELRSIYADLADGRQPGLARPTSQYVDFVRWQSDMLASGRGERLRAYWCRHLGGELPVLNLPTDRPRPAVQTFRGESYPFELDANLVSRLRRLARSQGVTLYNVLLTGFEVLLSRYSGQDAFLTGTPMLGRSRPPFERAVGYFVSPVVLRADLGGRATFRELLVRNRGVILEALEHQDYPFALLINDLQITRDPSRSPLFDVMFNYNDADIDAFQRDDSRAGLQLEPLRFSEQEGQFDLTLDCLEKAGRIEANLKYNPDLHERSTIERMAGHLRTLLAGGLQSPDLPVSALPMLTEREREHLLHELNPPERRFRQDACLHELFQEQCSRTPRATALSFEGRHVSYDELNRRANRLAHRLRALGVGPDVLVGLYVERSADLVVGILGILKAGGAYVPLDLAYPPERLRFILDDAGASFLVTQTGLLGGLQESHLPGRVICIDEKATSLAEGCDRDLENLTRSDHAAYVIYTSGSTGRPKGVIVTHSNVVRLFRATDHWFGFNARDVWTLFHSCAFDFSVWELWGALLHGGRLVVVPYLVSRSPEAIHDLIRDEGVTVLNQTPSAFRQLIQVDQDRPQGDTGRLRYVIFGGEALDFQSLRPWFDRHGDRRPLLVNMYGITETTVHVTYRSVTMDDVERNRGSMIGEPIPDLRLHVLDGRGELVPIGVPGELYVSGAGLARGYLHRPGLTAERFIANSIDENPSGRLYRTGDLVRRTHDGDIEYLGRVDHQVKIRGFRIELGEIQSILEQHPQIRQAVVLARENQAGGKKLVAYAAARGATPAIEPLRDFMRARLPEYMVPAAFVFLDHLPLTPHGKIDVKALPAETPERPALSNAFSPPVTEAERALAAIWSEVLGVDRVGIDDNFFVLGGDSILSIRVVASAQEQGLNLDVSQLFQHQTIRELARQARKVRPDQLEHRSQAPFSMLSEADRRRMPSGIEDAYPLAMAQAGILFHCQLEPETAIYCNFSSFRLRMPFDPDAMQGAIQEMAERHAILRTSFDLTSYSEPLQLVHREVRIPFEIEDIRHMPPGEQQAFLEDWGRRQRQRDFDWQKPPLIRFHVFLCCDDTIQFSYAEHHVIVDGWTVATMMAELFCAYLVRIGLPTPALPSPPITTYGDFVAMERREIKGPQARRFWLDRLRDLPGGQLPKRSSPGSIPPERRFRQYEVDVPEDVSEALERLARENGIPLKSLLLAAYMKALSVFSGRSEVVTGLGSNGRPETPDGERILGLFLNTLPVRRTMRACTWIELARELFAEEREALRFRRYPLAEMQRAMGRQNLVETAFNYIHLHAYEPLLASRDIEVLDARVFERSHFALLATFSLDPRSPSASIDLVFQYDANRLSSDQVGRLGAICEKALTALAGQPGASHRASCLLPDDDRVRLVDTFNETAADYPAGICTHELFEQQADRTPGATAVVCPEGELTYGELERRANQLAHYLRRLGVRPEVSVGLCVERSANLIIGLLGILKAGGVYVPLDPAYPRDRLAFMLADAATQVLLTQHHLAERLPSHDAVTLCLDTDGSRVGAMRDTRPANITDPRNAAYVIYTSGSTGNPKGVVVPHSGVGNMVEACARGFGVSRESRMLQFTSLSFDASIGEILITLLRGGTLCLPSALIRAPDDCLTALMRDHAITNVILPPSMLAAMPQSDLPGLRTIVAGGEECTPELVARWAEGRRFVNGYGPTEATMCATMSAPLRPGEPVTIGRPLDNTRVYILDEALHPVPVGVAGELCIAGIGLARGYLNRADLTASSFVPDPFSREPGARLYRTGDRACWREDGTIEFRGRLDDQVKIRGYRIEPGEIEAALRRHESVGDAAVVPRTLREGDRHLIAYVVAANGERLERDALRTALRRTLPEYMIPSMFVELDAMPLTANGKLDRQALPTPAHFGATHHQAGHSPESPTEIRLAEIWRRLLPVERVGVRDSFFDLGGHSLLATQLVTRIREAFGVALPLRTIFESPTLYSLAQVVDAARGPVSAQDSSATLNEDREEIEL